MLHPTSSGLAQTQPIIRTTTPQSNTELDLIPYRTQSHYVIVSHSGNHGSVSRDDSPHEYYALNEAIEVARRLISQPSIQNKIAFALRHTGNSPDPDYGIPPSPHYEADSIMKARIGEWFGGSNMKIMLFEPDNVEEDYVNGFTKTTFPRVININRQRIRSCAAAFEKFGPTSEEYHRALFFVITTLVHESMHGMRYLIKEAARPTPPKITYDERLADYIKEDGAAAVQGEGGWYLERSVFGGCVGATPCPDPMFTGEVGQIIIQRAAPEIECWYAVEAESLRAIIEGAEGWLTKVPFVPRRRSDVYAGRALLLSPQPRDTFIETRDRVMRCGTGKWGDARV